MHLLAVYAHPRADSFTGALLDNFIRSAEGNGHTVERLDLYRSAFTAYFTAEDFNQFSGQPMPDDVTREQARFDRAQGLVFAFPVWWWSFPAILKNYIDRLFYAGWAYHFTLERTHGMLADRPTVLLCSCGSSGRAFKRRKIDAAIENEIDLGTFAYCGLKDVRRYMFYAVDDRPDLRARFLREAEDIGKAFPRSIAIEPAEAG